MNFFNLFDKPQTAVLPANPPVPPDEPSPSRTQALETRIDRVCRAVGIDPASVEARAGSSSPLPAHIMEELQAGRAIQAIKLYREATGVGLKEAKEAIDAVQSGRIPQGAPRLSVLEAKLDAVLDKLESDR